MTADSPDPVVRTFPWSGLALNLLPLFGVWLLDWNLFGVMLLYWFEAALILIFGMARACWHGERPGRNCAAMLVYAPIYLGPAAGSVIAYGIAVVVLFWGPEPLEQWAQFPGFEALLSFLVAEGLWVAMALMLVSYAGDFARHWIASGTFRRGSTVRILLGLYGRVILFQLVTVAVAGAVYETGQGVWAVAVVVLVRVGLDLGLYWLSTRTWLRATRATVARVLG